MTTEADRAELAWDEWVRRVNPRLDRRAMHDAYLAGFRAGVELERYKLADPGRVPDPTYDDPGRTVDGIPDPNAVTGWAPGHSPRSLFGDEH